MFLTGPLAEKWRRKGYNFRTEEDRRETRRRLLGKMDPRKGGHRVSVGKIEDIFFKGLEKVKDDIGFTEKQYYNTKAENEIQDIIRTEDGIIGRQSGKNDKNAQSGRAKINIISDKHQNENTEVIEGIIRVPLIIKPYDQLKYDVEDIRRITKTILKTYNSRNRSRNSSWLKLPFPEKPVAKIENDSGSYSFTTWF